MPKAARLPYTTNSWHALENDCTGGNKCRLTVPCTQHGGDSCRLLEHGHEISEILLCAGLQLLENIRYERKGDACIALAQASTCGHVFFHPHVEVRNDRALDLVEWLLTEHRCITAIELTWRAMCRVSLVAALKQNRSLKSLTVCTSIHRYESASVLDVVKSLTHLEKLSFKEYGCDDVWNMCPTSTGSAPGAEMDHLTTLDVTELVMTRLMARRLVETLIRNRSITDLSVGEIVFSAGLRNLGALFVQYLVKEDSFLKRLTLTSAYFSGRRRLLLALIDAVCRMTSLEELNANLGISSQNIVGSTALFADVVARNATIRRLNLPSAYCVHGTAVCYHAPERLHPDAAKCMERWLLALRTPNSMLNELRIDLRGFDEAECSAFMNAVADNETLKLVTVHSLSSAASLDSVCKTIRRRGLSDRVIVEDLHVDPTTVTMLKRCPEISSAKLDARHFGFLGCVEQEAASSAFQVLGDCVHMNSLRVNCESFGRTALSALAACIRRSSTLKSVEIKMLVRLPLATLQEHREVEKEIISALASNTNLTRVSFKCLHLIADDLALFADDALKRRKLTEFCLDPFCIDEAMWRDNFCSWHQAEGMNTLPNNRMHVLASIQLSV
ncbi:uncharacterized protein LOC125947123 [Dermacentor silvarum]|uniref:uncharacterized protein LOC125947123 n=1 Tax=Dermacentor silvarum TaxID=543639 RepID=UPI002100F5D9|nr:uncharacterized protein LOC125947123 [Dermacentor silvarum]